MHTITNNINHVVYLIDASTSMRNRVEETVTAFDAEIKSLRDRSLETDQETRVSVYTFGSRGDIKCLIYDKDVMRVPSIRGHYRANGNTALRDAFVTAIDELTQIPQFHGNHAFLIYGLTDGEENDSKCSSVEIEMKLRNLPDNFTFGLLVPGTKGIFEAKRAGFPADAIQSWSLEAGVRESVQTMNQTTTRWFAARQSGQRGIKGLFKVDASALSDASVRGTLTEIPSHAYRKLPVPRNMEIRDFIQNVTGTTYITGAGYYQLTKTEEVQDKKQFCVFDKQTGKLYGGNNARQLLALPTTGTVKIKPGNGAFSKYDIFVQSTSVNRKLIAGTDAVIMVK